MELMNRKITVAIMPIVYMIVDVLKKCFAD